MKLRFPKFIKNLFSLKWFNVILLAMGAAIAIGTFPEGLSWIPFPPREIFTHQWFLLLCAYVALMTAYATWHLASYYLKAKPEAIDFRDEASARFKAEGVLKRSFDQITESKDVLSNFFQKKRFKIKMKHDATDALFIQARKNYWGRWGNVVLHSGMVLVLLGGLLTFLFANVQEIMLPEGETVSIEGEPLKVRLEKFSILFHEGTDKPEEYASRLFVQEKDEKPFRYILKVNNPMIVGGMRIFQMRYRVEILAVVLNVFQKGGNLRRLWKWFQRKKRPYLVLA